MTSPCFETQTCHQADREIQSWGEERSTEEEEQCTTKSMSLQSWPLKYWAGHQHPYFTLLSSTSILRQNYSPLVKSSRQGRLNRKPSWLNQWILTVAFRINAQGAIEHYVIENRPSLHWIDSILVFYGSHVNLMWPNWRSLRTLYQGVISFV